MMGINKRECRKYIDPKLTISPGSGVLLIEELKHIARASLKNIAGRRTLVVYFYNREKAAEGYPEPEYILFQCKDDYSTLQQIGDGTVKWREGSLENLGAHGACSAKTCAFYRQRDEQLVTRFCGISEKTGFDALTALQTSIMRARLNKRLIARDKKIIERMEPVPHIPRGLNGWIHREALPHYIFYYYKRGGKPMNGYCTACRRDIIVTGAKNNSAGKCPHCGNDITFKASGIAKRVWDRTTVQVLQRVSGNELVLRLFKVTNGLREWRSPDMRVWENARVFIRWDEANVLDCEAYYFSYSKGLLTHWAKGERPRYSRYSYYFECDFCAHLYLGNLDGALQGTPWQYSQIGLYYRIDREPMEALPYLRTYIKNPSIEYLAKLRLTKLVSDVVYRHEGAKLINEKGRSFKEALGIEPEDLSVMQNINVNVRQLELYQHLLKQGVRADEKLLTWYLDRGIAGKDDVLIPLRYSTPGKLMRYIDEQTELLKDLTAGGYRRYDRPGRVISDYKDYLLIGGKLGYDFSDDFVLYPKNLPGAHDHASKMYKNKETGILSKMIRASYAAVREQYCFTKDGLTLIPPKSANELTKEGHTLHHCVHTYAERVANGKCVILFLRRTDNMKEPFYTLELRDNIVTQVQGKYNCAPTPEVKKFLEHWKRKKLGAISSPKAA